MYCRKIVHSNYFTTKYSILSIKIHTKTLYRRLDVNHREGKDARNGATPFQPLHRHIQYSFRLPQLDGKYRNKSLPKY